MIKRPQLFQSHTLSTTVKDGTRLGDVNDHATLAFLWRSYSIYVVVY